MLVANVLTYCRNRMNETFAITPNWFDSELYQIMENKCNEAISSIGLIDQSSTFSTVANTQIYNYPTNMVRLRRVWCNGIGVKRLAFRQFESRQPSGIVPTGLPREMMLYNNQIYFTPIPDQVYTITVYGECMNFSTVDSTGTIDLPFIFHPAICDGMIMEMYSKDLNSTFYDRYEKKWEGWLISMREYAKRRRSRGMPQVINDADLLLETEFGVI